MTIGERMKDARKAKGLTQATLAEKVRLKRNTIANYETNNIEPSERSVFDICAVLGINEKWLLTGEGEMLRQLSEDEELELIFEQIHMSTDPTIRAIIRAYWKLPDPSVILADEPTGALDSRTGREVLGFLKKLNREGDTVVLITHDNSIAVKADRIIRLQDGKIIYDGDAHDPRAVVQPGEAGEMDEEQEVGA